MAIDLTVPAIQSTTDAQLPSTNVTIPGYTPNAPIPNYGQIFDQAQQTVPGAAEQAYTSKIADLNALLGTQAQASQEQAQQFGSLGGNEAQTRLADLGSQLKAADLQNQAQQQAYLQQTRQIGGYTQNAQTGGMEDINRANAVKKLGIAADYAIAQGQVETAKTLSEQAIQAKYGNIQQKIDNTKQFLDINKTLFEREDKKNYGRQQFILTQQQKDLDQKKKDATDISNMIIEATPNAPTNIISNAKKIAEQGGSKLAVAQALGVYGGDYLKTQLLKAQIDTERAQKAKYYADIDKIKSEMTTKGLPATTANIAKVEASQSVYDIAQELKTAQGKGGAVGFGIKKSVVGSLPFIEGTAIAGTDRATYEAKFKQLKDTLASANLDKLKGAMSDKDIEFLRNIGTALSLDMPETAFDAELDKVSGVMAKVPGVQALPPKPVNNKFNQALGISSQNIPGASIVNSVDDNGNINFVIPK